MTRYALTLRVHYRFDRPLAGPARQILRLEPAEVPGLQRVIRSALAVTPRPLERRSFTDFFGNRAVEVVVPPGTAELDFTVTAEVDRADPGALLDLSGDRAALASDLAGRTGLGPDSPHHVLSPSPRIPAVPDIAAFAARATDGAPTTRAAVIALGRALHAAMTFDAGATEVDTPIAQAFAGRRGVCQDFAQIMIAGLRSLGVPAAYVSGVLRTVPPPGQARLAGADAMHAWVRAWTGARGGWVDYDPTNAVVVGADHIEVAQGRDYGDCAPVTGSLRLDGAQSGYHSVDLEPLDD